MHGFLLKHLEHNILLDRWIKCPLSFANRNFRLLCCYRILKISFREQNIYVAVILQGVVTGVFSSLDMLHCLYFGKINSNVFLDIYLGLGKGSVFSNEVFNFYFNIRRILFNWNSINLFRNWDFVMYDIAELNLIGVSVQHLIL